MKPELLNLLDRLALHPGVANFQALLIHPNGQCKAIYQHGALAFPTLDDLEQFAYAPFEDKETVIQKPAPFLTMGLHRTPQTPQAPTTHAPVIPMTLSH